MSERLKELLEKINQEGVQAAEEKKREIESKAEGDAKRIIEDAKKEAKRIIEDADVKAEKTAHATEASLIQGARDLMLSLKDEIRKIFDKIIIAETQKAMSSEDMVDILTRLIEKYIDKKGETSDIKILLKKEDLDTLKKGLMLKLKEKSKLGIEFKPSPNINAGFSISFDKGKSYFDFTDESLSEALSAYLNPELKKLLQ